MTRCSQVVLREHQIAAGSIDHFLCHQASRRIVFETGRQLGFEKSKILWKLENFGNSSAATIPIALDLARKDQTIQTGNRLLLAAAGAGMAAAAAVIEL